MFLPKRFPVFLFLLFVCLFGLASLQAEEVNLALNKPYTLHPRPTYTHCTDPDDVIQLTDGQTTTSYFWTQKGTVGWVNAIYGAITLDLGAVESIGRFEMTTAAGAGGVEFPQAVFVQVSDDGKTFHEACELMTDDFEVHGQPPKKYTLWTLSSKKLETKGRFVRFLILAAGPFAFTDEIRVFKGEKDPAQITVTTPESQTIDEFFQTVKFRLCVDRRWQLDYASLQNVIQESEISEAAKAELLKRLETVYAGRSGKTEPESLDACSVLPLNPQHAEFYRIQAALWKAERPSDAPVLVSGSGIWDWLENFTSVKNLPKAEISVAAMQKETRSGAFCLFNATQEKQSVSFRIQGLQEAADWTVYRTVWTDTGVMTPVACALPEVKPTADGTYTLDLTPGMVQQVWVEFRTKDLNLAQKKTFPGKIGFTAGCGAEIPVALTVYPLVFPEKTTLMTGGWDYTNGRASYNVNALNRDDFIRCLKAHHVNAPWATNGVLLHGCKRNADGSVTIDTKEFDDWVALWKPSEVREYFIFMALGGWSSGETTPTFLGTKTGTPEFRQAMASWLGAWSKHWSELGIRPDQINLLLHDEPNETMKNTESFIEWSTAIHEACPGVKVWEDPCWTKFAEAPLDFFAACDVLCPNRRAWLLQPEEFAKFYTNQSREGRELNLYSCSGPQRLLDPYGYMLLQAWHAADIGATASFFWAMGDGGGVSSWSEYFLGRNSYSPLFIDPKLPTVTDGKHMKAIAAGAQDYEYIVMARKKLGDSPELKAAIRSVQDPFPSIKWEDPTDRGAADRARVQILEMMCK